MRTWGACTVTVRLHTHHELCMFWLARDSERTLAAHENRRPHPIPNRRLRVHPSGGFAWTQARCLHLENLQNRGRNERPQLQSSRCSSPESPARAVAMRSRRNLCRDIAGQALLHPSEGDALLRVASRVSRALLG